ncbi:MAG: hypothetical protein AB7J13_09210 [Pyrinomonadaceae bacterium]
MRILNIAGMLALLAAGLSIEAGAQTQAVRSIDTYCKTVDRFREGQKQPSLVFADTAEMDDEKAKWRKFPSEKALEDFREKSETYDIALNWRRNGRIVASNFTRFSPSGDWVNYVLHCFRTDGTLARVETDFRTFNGDFKVIRKRYFDRYGRRISMSVKYLDLATGKPKDPGSGVFGDDGNEIDYYLRTSRLPFAHLLRK